ncbi:hypothetical protein LB570_27350, partial [Mesorhizobium sp. BR1-1-5]|nr:hypothetical protein [Mesorhizobium sp. BR1-1-5]
RAAPGQAATRSGAATAISSSCSIMWADDADFALPPSGHGGDNRRDARLGKIDMLDRLIRDLPAGL